MNKIVKRTRIIGTGMVVHSVWEPYAGHSAMTWDDDGVHLGRVGTRPLPEALDALPAMSEERYQAVTKWHSEQYEEAYAAIRGCCPGLVEDRADMGELIVYNVPAGQAY